MVTVRWVWVGAMALATAGAAPCQRRAQPVIPAHRPSSDTAKGRTPWYAPVASLALPGLGQALLHQDRALAYVAVEAYSLLGYRAQIAEAERGRDRYRALAHDVARAFFGDPRPAGDWPYYEAMEKFVESGAFDRVPGGDVDPEIDETTYNGTIWKLARDTYWADPNAPPPSDSPAFTNAVSLYLRSAVRSDQQWSWRNAALEHDQYRRSISRSNDAFRRAREQLGVLIANHLLSMTDAFAAVRVLYPSSTSQRAWGLEVSLPWPRDR